MKHSRAFTIIELAIVITVIGIILGAIAARSGSLIGNAESTDTIALINDLSAAAISFKSKYHYLPGDMPLTGDEIPNVSAACNIVTSTLLIGNGKLDTATEVGCATEHLVRAGMIKGTINGISTKSNKTDQPNVFITARRDASSLPTTVLNEIQINNLLCDEARTIDRKMDDNDFSTGKIVASVATCEPNGINDPVPIIDVAI